MVRLFSVHLFPFARRQNTTLKVNNRETAFLVTLALQNMPGIDRCLSSSISTAAD